MTVSLRVDTKTKSLLDRLAKERGVTRSDVIRDAIDLLASLESGTRPGGATARERLAPYIGCVAGGGRPRSERTGEGYLRILKERARARRPG